MTSKEIENSIANYNPSNDIQSLDSPFLQVVDMVEKTVSEKSSRVYRQTYQAWFNWCQENAIDVMDINSNNVYKFLASGNTTIATRRRQLSAMRKFAQLLMIIDGVEARKLYEALKVIKAPKPSQEIVATNERKKTALTPSQADKFLRTWQDGDNNLSLRNDAMMRLLVFTGLRRSELANLTWQDIDLENQVVSVRHGKGDKSRTVAIMDNTMHTVEALKAWKKAIPSYRFVFVGVNKSHKIKADKPISDKTVYRVVQDTATLAGLPEIAPHDLRRTHITEYLASGGSLANAQAQAGHAQSATTLDYAQSGDAIERRKDANFRFGS